MCTDCGCSLTPHQHEHGRLLTLEQSLLARNAARSDDLRRRFRDKGITAVNLLSSPGSGKTSLLESLARTASTNTMAVLVGDLATDNDARRLQQAGLQAVQITTGQACHLEASMLEAALQQLPLDDLRVLMIENVGNLVCPAAYDLGESLRIVMLAVTEGEDKPLKYPATFHSADLVLISKVDLAEAVTFDAPLARRHITQVAPDAEVLEVSARSGSGLDALARRLGLATLQPR